MVAVVRQASKYDTCSCGREKTKVSARCSACTRGTSHHAYRGGPKASAARYREKLPRCACGAQKAPGAKLCRACNAKRLLGSGHHRYVGRGITDGGYVWLHRPDHPNAQKSGKVMEHVVIMADALGRPLYGDENVHHRNGDKQDNRLENLELWSTSQPPGQRVEDKVQWAKEILARYAVHESEESWLPS